MGSTCDGENEKQIVMDYYKCGSIANYCSSGNELSEEEIREIASCSLLGLEDLSTSHIIHRVMNEVCGYCLGH